MISYSRLPHPPWSVTEFLLTPKFSLLLAVPSCAPFLLVPSTNLPPAVDQRVKAADVLPVDHVGFVATTLYVDWLFTWFPFSFVWILSETVSLLSMIVLGEDCSGGGGLSLESLLSGEKGTTYFQLTIPGDVAREMVVLMRDEVPVGIAASVYWCSFAWLRAIRHIGDVGLERGQVRWMAGFWARRSLIEGSTGMY